MYVFIYALFKTLFRAMVTSLSNLEGHQLVTAGLEQDR